MDVEHPKPLLLKNLTSASLHEALAPWGADLRTARRMQSLAVKRGCLELPVELPQFKRSTWLSLRAAVSVPHLSVKERVTSLADGFTRYLFSGEHDDLFEAVRIPLLHREDDRKYIVCVSSQVGCALGCSFCATGKLGFKRNLATWEMVDQVVKIALESPHPVRGVVFMGMGEPLLNLERVLDACEILCDPAGGAIDAKSITISTAGIVPGIRQLATMSRPFRLVVSLVTADPVTRGELMPVEHTHSSANLWDALADYHRQTKRRINLAWPMLSGLNMDLAAVEKLRDASRGIPCLLNLIEAHDRSGRFSTPTPEEIRHFIDLVRERLSMPIVYRYSGGRDIRASCGSLTAEARPRENPPRS